MLRRFWLRGIILLRQNSIPLGLSLVWLVANAFAFWRFLELNLGQAVATALTLHKLEGSYGRMYTSFTELVVFGAVASVIVADATRRYRPELTCAALANRASNHVVVIGFSNLGKRIQSLCASAAVPVVVVSSDRTEVEALIAAEEPVVLGDAQSLSTLRSARIERARAVVIATDDLETAALACRLARAENPKAKLIVRCSDEDVGQVLVKAYSARVLSTSRIAARHIVQRAKKLGSRRALVMGKNQLGQRVTEALSADHISCNWIETTEDEAQIAQAGVREADLVVLVDDDLGKNLLRVDRIRDLNSDCQILCRVFHDDAAELLTERPFRCMVLSTSRLAAETLVEEGLFSEVGIARSALRKNARKSQS